MLMIVAVHLVWSVYTLDYDHYHAYSPDPETAKFLRPFVERGDKIVVTFIGPAKEAYVSTGILPYYDHSIYANQPRMFWSWSENNPAELLFSKELASYPKIVLAETTPTPADQPPNLNQPKVKLLTDSGYRLTNVFCGAMPQRLALGFSYCHLIFQYSGTAQR